jgi:hypothetical protein
MKLFHLDEPGQQTILTVITPDCHLHSPQVRHKRYLESLCATEIRTIVTLQMQYEVTCLCLDYCLL